MMDVLKTSLNSVCRLCLAKVDDPSTMQTLEDEETDTVWTASVRSFTLKKPMHSEILPNKMCSYCAVWITKLIHFKLQCQVSERLLTSLLNYYKEEVEKTTAVVRVGGQQWDVPVNDTTDLLSRYDEHLNRLHKSVQFTVTHLDKCAGDGEPVLPYRTVNTIQFYLTFIQHLLLSVNSVVPTDTEGILRTPMPAMNKEQPWDSNNMPVWAQEILNHSCGRLWDRFIQATCVSKSAQSDQSGAPSSEGPSQQFPLLQAVLCQSSAQPTACIDKSQMPTIIQLDDDDDNDIFPPSLNVSKSVEPKEAELLATLSSQPQRVITSNPQASSKQGGENIQNAQKTAKAQEKMNGVTEVWSSNIISQQQAPLKPSQQSVQLTTPAQNTNKSQAVQGRTSITQPIQVNSSVQGRTSITQPIQVNSSVQGRTSITQPIQVNSSVQGRTSITQPIQVNSSVQGRTSITQPMQVNSSVQGRTSITQPIQVNSSVQGRTSITQPIQVNSPGQNTNLSLIVQGRTSIAQPIQVNSPGQNTNLSLIVQGRTSITQPIQVNSPGQNTNLSQAVQGRTSITQPVQVNSPGQNTSLSQAVQGRTSITQPIQVNSSVQGRTSITQPIQVNSPGQNTNLSLIVQGRTSIAQPIQVNSPGQNTNLSQAVQGRTSITQPVQVNSPGQNTSLSQAVQGRTSITQPIQVNSSVQGRTCITQPIQVNSSVQGRTCIAQPIQVNSPGQNTNLSQALQGNASITQPFQVNSSARNTNLSQALQGNAAITQPIQVNSSAQNINLSQAVQGNASITQPIQVNSSAQNINLSQAVQGNASITQPVQLSSSAQNTNLSQALQGNAAITQPIQVNSSARNTNLSQALQGNAAITQPIQVNSSARNTNLSQALQGNAAITQPIQVNSSARNINLSQAVQGNASITQPVQLSSSAQNTNLSQALQGNASITQPIQVNSSAQNINLSQAVLGKTSTSQPIQVNSSAQNTNVSQVGQGKTSISQSEMQHSTSSRASVAKNQATEMLSEVREVLEPASAQENVQDQSLQSSVAHDLVESIQDAQKSMKECSGLSDPVVEHSYSLGTSSSAESANNTQESAQGCQRTQELYKRLEDTLERLKNEAKKRGDGQKTVIEKSFPGERDKTCEKQESQSVLKETSKSQETAKQTLELNRVQEETNETSSKEQANQPTNLPKQTNSIQKSQGQMDKTNEFHTSERHQTGSEVQTSATEAAASSSSGQESSTKSTEEPRLQTRDKQRFFDLILQKAISRAYEREKTVPAILKRRKRVRSYEDLPSPGLEKHIELRIKSEPVEKQSRPSSAPNAGVFDVLPPLMPIPKNTAANAPSGLLFTSKLKERPIGKEIPSSISTSINNENSVASASSSTLSSHQPNTTDNINMSHTLAAQKDSSLAGKSSENCAAQNSSPATTKRSEENRKSSEEAPAAKEPAAFPRGFIRVRQDLATDPAVRSASHNSKQPEPSNNFTTQQQKQANAPNLAQSFLQPGVTVRLPVSVATAQQTGLPFVQHTRMPGLVANQHQPWMLKQPGLFPATTNVSQALPLGVITTVYQNVPPYTPNQTPQRVAATFPVSALGNGSAAMSNLYQRHLGIVVPESEHFKEPWISQLVVQLQSLQNGAQSSQVYGFPQQKNTPVSAAAAAAVIPGSAEQLKTASRSHGVPVSQQNTNTQYNGTVQPSTQQIRVPTFPLASMNRMAVLQQQQANPRVVGMPVSSQLSHPVAVSQQLNVSKVNSAYPQQASVITSVVKNPVVPQVSQPSVLRPQMIQVGTGTSTIRVPWTTISVPQYPKAQTTAHFTGGPRMSVPMPAGSSTAAAQTQQAKPATAVMQSTNTVSQALQSNGRPPVPGNSVILSAASGTRFPNPTAVSKAMALPNQSTQLLALRACVSAAGTSNISVPRVYKPATGQREKQQLLNVSTQCNTASRPSEDGRSEAGPSTGISVLPQVVRAIGPELGVFMEEDGLETSGCRTTPWNFPIVVPDHHFMAKQSNKTPAQKLPKGAAALARAVRSNMISLMEESSREVLGVSEERWQKLQAAVADPKVFRKSNWRLIKPPGGIKIRRYFNRKKQEANKEVLPVQEAPEPGPSVTVPEDSIRVGDVLQSEVAALFGTTSDNRSEADKPCDFRIKITKNNGKYESSAVDHSAVRQVEFDSDSSDSWELYVPRAKRRRIIYDDEEQEIEKPPIKVWQLQPYELAPYVSVTRLQPEFFEPGCVYDLKDVKVAAMAEMLSTVVRKPGTVGTRLEEETSQSILPP